MPVRILSLMITLSSVKDFRSLLAQEGFFRRRRSLDGLEARRNPFLSPDIVVMDISMPAQNGLNVAREVHKFFPQVKVILLSQHTRGYVQSPTRSKHVSPHMFSSPRLPATSSTPSIRSRPERFITAGYFRCGLGRLQSKDRRQAGFPHAS